MLQLEMLRVASLVQCCARQWNVLSDSFLQLDRSRVLMIISDCNKMSVLSLCHKEPAKGKKCP